MSVLLEQRRGGRVPCARSRGPSQARRHHRCCSLEPWAGRQLVPLGCRCWAGLAGRSGGAGTGWQGLSPETGSPGSVAVSFSAHNVSYDESPPLSLQVWWGFGPGCNNLFLSEMFNSEMEVTGLTAELCWPRSAGAAVPGGSRASGVVTPGRWPREGEGRGILPWRNAAGCAGVPETWRVGTRARAQGCVLGIALEPGRSRQGSEHDLENPSGDEKVQSASTFLRRPGCAQRAARLGWQRARRLHGAPANRSLSCPQEMAPCNQWQGWPGLRVHINLRDRLLRLTDPMHFIYK